MGWNRVTGRGGREEVGGVGVSAREGRGEGRGFRSDGEGREGRGWGVTGAGRAGKGRGGRGQGGETE